MNPSITLKLSTLLQIAFIAAVCVAAWLIATTPGNGREGTDTPPQTTSANTASTPTLATASTSATRDPEFYNTAALRRENDGHYWALANMEGQFIKVMVDTGASTVALTAGDARKIGYDPEALDYRYPIRTAGGEVMGAYVELAYIKIGNVRIENVEAMVLRDGLTQSLLGMSFLGQLYSYEFKGDTLIFRK